MSKYTLFDFHLFQNVVGTPFFSHHHGHQLFLSRALVSLECCQSVEGLKVEEEEEEGKDYPVLERYQSKFVVLPVGLV
jgi:hypothetical protein